MDRLQRACCASRARRRQWPAAVGAGLIAAIGCSLPAAAQDISEFQRELKQMRQQYEAELNRMRRDYDARLSRLENRLKAAERKPNVARTERAATDQPSVPLAPSPPTPPTEVPPAVTLAAPPTFTIGTPPREPWPIGPATPPIANPSASAGAFNPAIGVVLQGKASAFSQNPDTYRVRGFALGDEAGPGKRGLSLDETELNFQASVDPYLFGNATLSISPENHISVEEAFIQTTSLPAGFTLRAGRFFSGIGYLNEQHSHTWDFADQALPYRVFLNNQYDDDGVQLRWLAPTRQFLEFGGELFRGDAFPAGGAAACRFRHA